MTVISQLNNCFQIAYVTNDIDQAADLFRDRYGTGDFQFMRELPGGQIQIALAFAGDMMIELIQPINDTLGVYANWIAGERGFAVRHHHFGLLVNSKDELAAIRAAHAERGLTVVMEGEMPGMLDFLYVDTTAELGHYLEYVLLDAGGRAMFASIPGSPFVAQ